jgi:hypothetical protein
MQFKGNWAEVVVYVTLLVLFAIVLGSFASF